MGLCPVMSEQIQLRWIISNTPLRGSKNKKIISKAPNVCRACQCMGMADKWSDCCESGLFRFPLDVFGNFNTLF
jgi:hypothetical protein